VLSVAERFWSKVDRNGPDAPEGVGGRCWVWTSARNSGGYGVFQVGRSTTLNAHRVAFELWHGALPPRGMVLDHLCRVRHCVNPAHLEPVTPRENVLRGATIVASNARKTACPKGHPYDHVNVDGARCCRRCRARAAARAYERRKERNLTNGALA
jgi:hypothetical protein